MIGFLRMRGSVFDAAEETGPAAEAPAEGEGSADPKDEHGGDGVSGTDKSAGEDDGLCEGARNERHRYDDMTEGRLGPKNVRLGQRHARPGRDEVSNEGDDKGHGVGNKDRSAPSVGLPRIEHEEEEEIEKTEGDDEGCCLGRT